MAAIDGTFLDFKSLDLLAAGNTPLHRLDPRAKVLATFLFIFSVVSFGRYELTALFPFFLFPAAMVAIGNLPVRFILKKVGLILPFAVLVGLFNPVFDHRVLFHIGTWEITGGWVSLASITVRAMLTAGAAVVLVGLTGFPAICAALERLGMPKAFTVQLLFLYRYIFVLTEEGARAARARELRSFGKKGRGLSSYGPLVGHLLLRTWMRAERIHTAMLARGFTGDFHTRENFRFGRVEVLFLVGWTALFILFRLQNVSHLLGSFILGMLS